jgi:hypothetical protein
MNVIIVDSHNEVLPYWFRAYLKLKLPLVVVRVDKHHDMNQECPVLPAREGRNIFDHFDKIMPYIFEYAKEKLNEGNFTCPAFHYGIVGALYHFNPRNKEIDAYGRVLGGNFINSPRTTLKSIFIGGNRINRIFWDGARTKIRCRSGKVIPVPQSLPLDVFKHDMDGCENPIVIGFDLDGLYGIDEKGPPQEEVTKRIERVNNVLECVSSPILALVARSQKPKAYVPPMLVECLQETAVHLIERWYNGVNNN